MGWMLDEVGTDPEMLDGLGTASRDAGWGEVLMGRVQHPEMLGGAGTASGDAGWGGYSVWRC